MAADPLLLKLNKNLADEFVKNDLKWKRVSSGASVLLQYNFDDFYLFIGTHLKSKSKSNYFQIALFSKDEKTIEKLRGKYNSLPEFNNSSIYPNFIAIRQLWYESNLLEIVNNQSVSEAETIVLEKYKEEWQDLVKEIKDAFFA